jgi:hypothetical protein
MAEDYMSDGEDFAEAPEAEASPASAETRTALIPIDFFEGKDLEPGTECTIRIAKVHDDQVEAEYVPHAAEEEFESGEEMGAEMQEAMSGGMEEMMG